MSNVIAVNENDEEVGIIPREIAHRDGILHRITIVYVENDKGEILVQVRTSGKLDHSAAGHVDPGETYLEAATRELQEELSIESNTLVSIGKGRSDRLSAEKDGIMHEQTMHIFEVFVCRGEPGILAEQDVQKVYWEKPEVILVQMEKEPSLFASGFIASLPIYMNWKSKS